VAQLSETLNAAREQLRGMLHPEEVWAWVGISLTDTAGLLATPLGQLVSALGDTPDMALQRRRWGSLCVAVARRLLACWEFYCDTDPLSLQIQAASERVFRGLDRGDWQALEQVTTPTYRGKPLPDDCDVTAPNNAVLAVSWCVSCARDGLLNDVVGCVREADRAFAQSGLGHRDQFRRWFLEFAVPAAWEGRELTSLEQGAMRAYNIASVRRWRDDAAD
jgi:hypothetical protein